MKKKILIILSFFMMAGIISCSKATTETTSETTDYGDLPSQVATSAF